MDLPEVITPEELAKHLGWSARRVREMARQLGAHRLTGRSMRLTIEDVHAILEAAKPVQRSRTRRVASTKLLPEGDYATLVAMRNKLPKR